MNKKKEIVPKLRFPEFSSSEGWKNYKLIELADRIIQKVGDNKLITLSISAGIGFVSQTEKFSRDISGMQYSNYIHLKKGEFSYNKGNSKTFPQGCIYELKEYDEAAVPNAFISFKFKENLAHAFYKGYFDNNFHGKQLVRFITSGARSDGLLNISPIDFFSIILPTPIKKEEQQKIADCLSSIDELISAENRKLKALEKYKKGLMQKLFPAQGQTQPEWRFPEFKHCGDWEICTVENSFDTITPPKKLQKSEYNNSGKYPIIDQSQEYIAGWTDDESAIVPYHRPLIVFGDHTCVLKFISQPFVQGADGIKILSTNNKLYEKFAYYCLENIPLNSNGYQRHYSTLKEFVIKFPNRNSDEQQKIADCLSEIDTMITAQSNKVEQLKAHKKGLMQGLFPSLEELDL